jgi:hypothetical protein
MVTCLNCGSDALIKKNGGYMCVDCGKEVREEDIPVEDIEAEIVFTQEDEHVKKILAELDFI